MNIRNKINRILSRPSVPFGGILMLHRIEKQNPWGLWANEHLKMSSDAIEQMAKYAKVNGCSFVSMDELYEVLKKRKYARKLIVTTLDDGYKDNYTNGYPYFKALNIPFCINLCMDILDGKQFFWWYLLEDVIQGNDSIEINDGRVLDCSTKDKKEKVFQDIKAIISTFPQKTIQEDFYRLLSRYCFDKQKYNNLGMSWDDINDMKRSSLATFGNHTVHHSVFRVLSEADIDNEVLTTQKRVKDNTGIQMEHFAFPYGSTQAVSEENFAYMQKFGFKTIVTTFGGLVKYGTVLQRLPRFSVTDVNWKNAIDQIVTQC